MGINFVNKKEGRHHLETGYDSLWKGKQLIYDNVKISSHYLEWGKKLKKFELKNDKMKIKILVSQESDNVSCIWERISYRKKFKYNKIKKIKIKKNYK